MSDAVTIAPLRILVVDDEANIRLTLSICLEADGHTVVAESNIDGAMEAIARQVFDLVFLDIRLGVDNGLVFLPKLRAESPWAQVVVITAFASIETAVEAMKRGAIDYLPKPFEPAQVQLLTQKVSERLRLERRIESLQATLGAMDAEADLPTSAPAMREAIELARQVAPTRAAVLITGEPGTGKGRLARAIHALSPRAGGPLATVSCQQPDAALEADLFGVVPAHAGTHSSPGRIAYCDGGTLILDEVGHTPARLQAKLLRVAQDNEYERVDETSPRAANVRLISTTSQDLGQAVTAGLFRQELLLSLNVVEINIPPLRHRPQDIPLLTERYTAFFCRENHRVITGMKSDALAALSKYQWPGNVRELRNVIERAVLLCRTELIGIEHLPPNLLNSSPTYAIGDLAPLETIEKMHILKVVASTRSLRRAAAILQIDSGTLCRRMKRYDPASEDPPPT